MKYNNVDLSDRIVIRKIRRSIAPPQLLTRRNVPGMNGSLQMRKDDGDRLIDVDIALLGDSRADYLEEVEALAPYLMIGREAALVFPDEPDRTYTAIVSGDTDMEEFRDYGEGTITFICQPYKLGLLKTTAASGTNAGSVTTPCEITVTMTGASSSLKVQVGTQFVLVTTPLVLNDVVVIDTLLRTVELNGTDVRDKVSFTSTFFELPVGAFTVTPTPASTVAVKFREMYL